MPNSPTTKDKFQYFSQQVGREDTLINNRLTWMLTAQGFFFGTLAIVGASATNQDVDRNVVDALKIGVPIIGVAIAISALLGILAAHQSFRDYRKDWKKVEGSVDFPSPFGGKHTNIYVLSPSICLPLVIVGVWFFIMYRIW